MAVRLVNFAARVQNMCPLLQTASFVFLRKLTNAARKALDMIMLAAAAAFMLAWLVQARPHDRPKSYRIVPFDVFGRPCAIDGIRTEFRTFDVAWSFMKDYKAAHPLHDFALVSGDCTGGRPTIFRYV